MANFVPHCGKWTAALCIFVGGLCQMVTGEHFTKQSPQSTVLGTMNLGCHKVASRSSLELATVCVSRDSCMGMKTSRDLANHGMVCSCPGGPNWSEGTGLTFQSTFHLRSRTNASLPAHAVSLPMNEVIGNVLLGSINGTMTSGISLVPGQVGNGLHMTGNTGRVDLGFHQFECFYNPDSCSQGVTFAVWVKREHGSKDGYLLNTGATRRDSKGYNIRILATRMLKISVKSGTRYDYFDPNVEWVADEWSHLSATWTVGHGIRAYLNGCDMDADDIKGYASAVTRSEPVSTSLPFQLGYSGGWDAAVGTTIDELFVWDGLLNSYQILELYMQGGTM